jgi:type I restriction enzyme S subunit
LNKVVVAQEDGYCTSEILPLPFVIDICPEYVRLLLMSDYFLAYANQCSYGVKMPRLGTTDGKKAMFPLPPLEEQKRIATVATQAIEQIEMLDAEKASLVEIVTAAKSKILSLAITGKLVPQDPNDEPASVLMERIRAEREQLIKEGKIKATKGKKTVPASLDNSYYEKVCLGEVCQLLNSQEVECGELPYLEVRYLRGKMSAEAKTSGRFVKKGTPVILVDGENSGEVFFAPEDGYMGSTFRELLILHAFDIDFVLLFISHYQKVLRDNKTGSAIPHLNKKLFAELELPLLPLNRQVGTVAIVRRYFSILDEVTNNLI